MRQDKLALRGVLTLAIAALGWMAPSPDLTGTDGPEEPAAYYLAGNDAVAPEPEVASVAQKDKSFRPSLVAVSVGSTVEFPNRDDTVHNVYGPKGGALGFFDLGSAEKTKPDGSNLLTKEISKKGVVKISCAIHPVMKGNIVAVPSQFHTVSTDGTYEFSDVPAGEYDVMVMNTDGEVSKLKTVQID